MTLVPVDPTSEASVITLLERAQQWLSEAVHRGEPGDIAMVKAQMATAAEATKQLGLSKDIQLDAQEMVRRAEYALGKAIRRGQEEGTILAPHEPGTHRNQHGLTALPHQVGKSRVTDFATPGELSGGSGRNGIYALTDGVEFETFNEALETAKSEGDLSRANVVRKVKGQSNPAVVTRDMRADVIADLAVQGYTSQQMVSKVSVSAETIRQIARDFNIEIPADKVTTRRRMDHTQSVDNFVTKVENTVSTFQYVDLDEVDLSQADEWVASLTASIAALNRIKKQIAKEATHV